MRARTKAHPLPCGQPVHQPHSAPVAQPGLFLPAPRHHSQLCPLRALMASTPFRGSQESQQENFTWSRGATGSDSHAGQTLLRPKSTSMAEDRSATSPDRRCPPLPLPAAQVPYLKGPLRRPNTPLRKLRLRAGESQRRPLPSVAGLAGWKAHAYSGPRAPPLRRRTV